MLNRTFNLLKTFVLLSLLTLSLLAVGYRAGGEAGLLYAFLISCGLNLGIYGWSDRMVLAMFRAQPVAEEDAPAIYEIIRRLAGKGGLSMPRVFLIPSASPNVFSVGRHPRRATIAITRGIVDCLNGEELEGVFAHELAHIRHYDTVSSSVAAALAGAVHLVVSVFRWAFLIGGGRRDAGDKNPLLFILKVILMPLAAAMVWFTGPASREFHADEKGAFLCGEPLYLASALRKLEAGIGQIPMRQAPLFSAPLFFLMPVPKKGWARLFSTHPAIEDRLARLIRMAG